MKKIATTREPIVRHRDLARRELTARQLAEVRGGSVDVTTPSPPPTGPK